MKARCNLWTTLYLKVFALNDEIPILVPLDGGLGNAVDLTLELNVALLNRDNVLGTAKEARSHLDLKDRGRVHRVLRVLCPALIRSLVLNPDVFNLQTSLSDSQEPRVEVVEVHRSSVLEPRDVGLGDTIGGAVEGDA